MVSLSEGVSRDALAHRRVLRLLRVWPVRGIQAPGANRDAAQRAEPSQGLPESAESPRDARERANVSAPGSRGTVLEVCHYYGPYPGNFIPTLLATSRGVSERLGLEYHCLFPDAMKGRPWVRLFDEAGVQYSFVTSSGRLGVLAQLGRVAKSTNASIIRSHFSHWDIESGLVARRHGAASVWHMHSGRFGRTATVRSRARSAVKFRALGGLCDRVFAVSDDLHRLAAARGFPERKINTVLNGIDVGRFDGLPSRQEARALVGIDTTNPIALGFAWSPYTKGTDVLVEAARPLGEAGKLTVVLVGDSSLEHQFGGPGAPWLKVVRPRDDVGTIFAASDIFVSSSRDEGFPYSIGEAMASGLPVISSDIAGPAPYFAAEGVLTFPSEDTTELTAALRTMLDHASPQRLGLANRAYIENHLDLSRHVNHVTELFEALLPGRPT